jgi:hypothetical protein
MKKLLLVLFVSALASGTALADSFRCNNIIFYDGNSRADVLLKCGEPDFEDVIMESTSVEIRPEEVISSKKEYVVEWYYNCGENQFIKVVKFKAGKIISIRNGKRGLGENPRNCW